MTTDEEALREFVAQHSRPYDPETDTYDRPPFAADIKEGKNDPIYNAHSYHTKVPPRGIIPYILHYTEPGDLILDPFCGSGMTGVAALMCADPPPDFLAQFPDLADRVGPRRAILNDLSPAACHIAYNYTTPVDVEALRQEFERIKAAVKDEFDWLYGTEHYEPAVGAYDPRRSEVAERLKNPVEGTEGAALFESGSERTWELVDRAEVERRLGYPVTDLPRGKDWGERDVTAVEQWVVIPATIQYTIWSDVYRCEGFVTLEEPTGKTSTRGKNAGKPIVRKRKVTRGCGGEIVLWEALVDKTRRELRSEILCATCSQPWLKDQLPWIRSVPVAVYYEMVGPDGARRRKEVRPTVFDRARLTSVEKTPISGWVPATAWRSDREMWRGGHRDAGISGASDFFTPRNLRALAVLRTRLEQSEPSRVRRMLQFSFTALLHRSSKLLRIAVSYYLHGGGGPVAGPLLGTLYIPSFSVESNVGLLFERRQADLEDLTDYYSKIHASSAAVRRGSASSIREIPDASIDFVFVDPPFGSNIFYADCSFLWESWLGEHTDERLEAVWNKSRKPDEGGKTLADYSGLMDASFREMFRVLKPGRWCTVEFNNSDGAVFDVIRTGIEAAGFTIENMLILDKKQRSFKQLKGVKGTEDVVDKDVIFNLHKPSRTTAAVTSVDHDLERHVVKVVREHLQTLPERMKAEPAKYSDDYRTTATLNSVLMNALLPQGVGVENLNLPFIERVCGRYFRKVGQRWYLRGEAVGGAGGSEGLFAEEVAVSDEESAIRWLRQRLGTAPALVGELRPHWMRATGLLAREVSEGLVLEDLLASNFWRDEESNRWRDPSDEERERMNDDRALRVLHDAERFVDGSLKRQPSEVERAGWIETLYRAAAEGSGQVASGPSFQRIEPAAAYTAIVRLFHGLLAEKLDPEVGKRVRKQSEAASAKLKKLAPTASESTAATKDGNLSLFDDPGGKSR